MATALTTASPPLRASDADFRSLDVPQLTWLGDHDAKRAARRVPYRMLEQIEQVGDPTTGNMLVQGDNLDALKALLPFYAGRVKCIFIDPPYNTKSAFEHYDDNLEHSQWLSMMYPRLELLRDLLSEDGLIWVTLDDNEAHYLKILLDEVFGRKNSVASVIWEKSDSPRMDAKLFSSRHDNLLVHAKNISRSNIKKIPYQGDEAPDHYDKVDIDGRRFYLKPLRAMGAEGTREARPTLYFAIEAPDGTAVYPKNKDGSDGRWRWSKDRVEKERWRIQWVRGKRGWSAYFRIYADENVVGPPETLWFHKDVGSNRTSKNEVKALGVSEKPFETPKPEALIQRVLDISTEAHDIVLDSFLGSGTTAAVAHKMGRRWIGIEMGEHARTHCLPRLIKVVEGGQGGISQNVKWKGGGGFQFFRLGEPAFDAAGRIHPSIGFATLAAYVWFLEVGTPHPTGRFESPLLGEHGSELIHLLYNGILGDRRPAGGNVLTHAVLDHLIELAPDHHGLRVVYGEASRISAARLKDADVVFRQIPYDIRMR